jgi:phosphoserine phosphatase
MNYKQYSREIWDAIEMKTHAACEGGTAIAVFDADGTLWDTDLGENFFSYLIDQKLIHLPKDPWNYYTELKQKNNDPREAYLWLAQILSGKDITEVQNWAEDALKAMQPFSIFPEQKKLIDLFLMHEVQVYIVTASVKWAVEPGAKILGIKPSHVIGVETEINDGVVSKTGVLPVTYKEGKVEALLKATQGAKPFFASGNTMGDYALLEAATDIRLAVSAASRDDRLFKTEKELLAIAQKSGWFAHRFIMGSTD